MPGASGGARSTCSNRAEAAEQPLPSRARELIGKDPEIAEVFDLEASVSVADQLARLGSRLRVGALSRPEEIVRLDRFEDRARGRVLRVAMARPERRNAFDAALIDELAAAFADVGDARAVVLSGDGPSFSAGADVEWMRSSVDLSFDENVADALRLRAMLDAIDTCPAPVDRAGSGSCARRRLRPRRLLRHRRRGARSGVCVQRGEARHRPRGDLTVRAREDRPGAARRYFVTGERFSAAEALRIGFVHELADDLDAAVEQITGEVLSAGPTAARAAKELARAPLPADETARRIAAHRTSPEGQDGLRAFLEKRRPTWNE